MRKIFLLLILFSVFGVMHSEIIGAFGTEKTYDYGQGISQTSDGGYLITGKMGYADKGYVIKLRRNGTVEWSSYIALDESKYVQIYSGYEREDGNYVVFGNNDKDLVAIVLDSSGRIVESHFIGTEAREENGRGIILDDGYLLIGNTLYYSNYRNAYIVKLDKNFNKVWELILEKTNYGNNIIKGHGDYYIACGSYNNKETQWDSWVTKIDLDGNIIWHSSIEEIEYQRCYDVTEDENQNVYTIGDDRKDGINKEQIYLSKYDRNGNLIASTIIRNKETPNKGYAITYDQDRKHIAITGTVTENNDYNLFFYLLDSRNLVVLSRYIYGAKKRSSEFGYDIIRTDDGGFAISGYTEKYGPGGRSIYFIKTNSRGASCSSNGPCFNSDTYIEYVEPFNEEGDVLETLDFNASTYILDSNTKNISLVVMNRENIVANHTCTYTNGNYTEYCYNKFSSLPNGEYFYKAIGCSVENICAETKPIYITINRGSPEEDETTKRFRVNYNYNCSNNMLSINIKYRNRPIRDVYTYLYTYINNLKEIYGPKYSDESGNAYYHLNDGTYSLIVAKRKFYRYESKISINCNDEYIDNEENNETYVSDSNSEIEEIMEDNPELDDYYHKEKIDEIIIENPKPSNVIVITQEISTQNNKKYLNDNEEVLIKNRLSDSCKLLGYDYGSFLGICWYIWLIYISTVTALLILYKISVDHKND